MKTIEEFVKLFAEQFDETDTSNFTADTDFRANDEWSSLLGLSIIAMIDDEFDIAIKGNDIKSSKTIGELYDKIIGRQ